MLPAVEMAAQSARAGELRVSEKLEENECGRRSLRTGVGTHLALLLASLGVGRGSWTAGGTGTPQQPREM